MYSPSGASDVTTLDDPTVNGDRGPPFVREAIEVGKGGALGALPVSLSSPLLKH